MCLHLSGREWGKWKQPRENELPQLLEFSDLKGCFHNHTTASDGRNTLEEVAAEADRGAGEYLGIADHSKASFQANGLDEERLLYKGRPLMP